MTTINITNELILQNINLANSIAKIKKKTLKFVSLDELQSAAYFGLVQAANKFDPNKKTAFSTYAYIRIVGAIKDYLRELSWGTRKCNCKRQELVEQSFQDVTSSVDDLIFKLSTTNKQICKLYYEESLGISEIAKIYKVNPSRISQILTQSRIEIKQYMEA
jgi:RNA polymerase sigma factor (sigma-70 family)